MRHDSMNEEESEMSLMSHEPKKHKKRSPHKKRSLHKKRSPHKKKSTGSNDNDSKGKGSKGSKGSKRSPHKKKSTGSNDNDSKGKGSKRSKLSPVVKAKIGNVQRRSVRAFAKTKAAQGARRESGK